MKINALIRYYFKTDPLKLKEEDWIQLAIEAIWLEKYQIEKWMKLLENFFKI